MKTAAFALAAHSPFAAALSQPLQSHLPSKWGCPPPARVLVPAQGPAVHGKTGLLLGSPCPRKGASFLGFIPCS